MSKLSFKSFCIEYYAEHIGKPSNEVYLLFKKEKLLDLLDTDYDDLHGMGMEYLMCFFDDYLGKSTESYCITTHATVRATLTPEIIRLIMEKYSLSESDALDKFYTSAAGVSFADDETGLYGQSALYVFGVFDEEMKEKVRLEARLDG